MKRVAAILVLMVLASCSESFDGPSFVDNLRVVAARVTVEGKGDRANPDPGDTVTVDNLVIDGGKPDAQLSPPPLQWSLLACIPEPSVLPVSLCRTVLPCAGCIATPPDDPLALPIVTFQIPSAAELEEANATTVVLQGAICADGPPAGPDAILRFFTGETDDLNPCENPEDEGRFISAQVLIEQNPDNPNNNPEIEDVKIFLEGGGTGEWPPPFNEGVPRDEPVTGCALRLPENETVPIGGDPAIGIGLTATQDSFQVIEIDDEDVTEEMQISWLADNGTFEFSFSFIAAPSSGASEAERTATILWLPPSFPSPDGTLVRFTFPMRDRASPVSSAGANRGGVDYVQRGLCVVPP